MRLIDNKSGRAGGNKHFVGAVDFAKGDCRGEGEERFSNSQTGLLSLGKGGPSRIKGALKRGGTHAFLRELILKSG